MTLPKFLEHIGNCKLQLAVQIPVKSNVNEYCSMMLLKFLERITRKLYSAVQLPVLSYKRLLQTYGLNVVHKYLFIISNDF